MAGRKTGNLVFAVFMMVACFCGLLSEIAAGDQQTIINIGVLARRGNDASLKEWSPTAEYLSERLPGFSFKIVPLTFKDISSAVEGNRVDFVIANPYVYVELQNLYGVSRMATLKRLTHQGHTALFGGSIFVRADNKGISSLSDLKGHSFIAVDATSFGGWMVAWRELQAASIDPYRDFKKMMFAGTHDDVVLAVRDGKVDAGTVATPILQQMIAEGKITQNTFRIINNKDDGDCSCHLSTRLYPEWPFARLKHTPDDIAEKVAIALLAMPQWSAAAISAQIAGWTVPFDYGEVQACMQELQVGIYKNFGKITLVQLFTVYRWRSVAVIVTIIVLFSLLLVSSQLNRKLRHSESTLVAEMRGHERASEELAKANAFLKQSRQELANIIDFLPDATFVVDKDKKVISWNRAMEEMTGVSKAEMIGQGDNAYTVPFYGKRRRQLLDLFDLDDEELRKNYTYVQKNENTLFAEAYAPALYGGKGAAIWTTAALLYDEDGNHVGAIESIRDITAQKLLEAERQTLQTQLIQSQKMQAIGTLAGGIAHDFNNILGAVLGYAEMVEDECIKDSTAAQYTAQIIKAGHRAKDLVKQILAFSRQEEVQHIPVQPAVVIKEAIKLMRASLPVTIAITQDIDPNAGVILADPTQVHQIVINLCTNAFHAMELKGGTLAVSLHQVTLPQQDLGQELLIQPGNYVHLSVQDTGAGMAPEVKEKVFEPYFTTKEIGKGTGMGLSTVYGIVQSYGGAVFCHTELNKGTVFHVLLPLISEAPMTVVSIDDPIPQGHERILLVDDEEMLADMGRNMLAALGYQVTIKTQSLEALTVFQEQPERYDLVITDQTMPNMTGIELARQILQLRPGLPIILCTGFSSVISEEKAKSLGIKGFALKPLVKKQIAALIRKVLEN